MSLPEHRKGYCRLAGVLKWFSKTTGFLVVPYNGDYYLLRRDDQEWVHMARGPRGGEQCEELEVRYNVFSEIMHKLRLRKGKSASIEVQDVFEELCSHVESSTQTFLRFCEKPGKGACSQDLVNSVVPRMQEINSNKFPVAV